MKTVVVLGMHRSGTSLVSMILHHLGVKMSPSKTKFLPANNGNKLGHYENTDFVNLNDKILHFAGGDYFFVPEKDRITQSGIELNEDIDNTIRNNKSQLWGWKDPRTCLTFDCYIPFLTDLKIVSTVRDIDSNIESFRDRRMKGNRNDIKKFLNRKYLMSLYNIYMSNVFHIVSMYNGLVTKYEYILEKPEKSIYELIRFLDINPMEDQFKNSVNLVDTKQKRF